MPMQCPNCKAINRDTATFCDTCGTRLIGASPPDVPPMPTTLPSGPPLNLPEEPEPSPISISIASPQSAPPATPTARPRPAPAGRPEMLPEEKPSSEAPAAAMARPAPGLAIQPPYIAPGRPRRYPHILPWLVVAGALFGAVVYLYDNSYPKLTDMLSISAMFAVLSLLVGAPLQFWLSRACAKGIVTHMRMWGAQPSGILRGERAPQSWMFDLCLTDDNWRPLMDRKGFQLPIVEVAFRSDRVHGAPVEEGSQAVLKGRWRKDRIEVKDLWNLTPGPEVPTYGALTAFWGRVSELQATAAADLRYPGEKQLEVWSFRLQLTDPTFEQLQRDTQGNLLAPWPVEIRAASISGPLSQGDKVEVRGRVVRGTVYAKDVRNHSAGGASLAVKQWAGIPS
jgi:hypothetical protein